MKVLTDALNGSHLGVASSPDPVLYENGKGEGQSADFQNNTDYIQYDNALFPLAGTISLDIKSEDTAGTNRIFDTIGSGSAANGDVAVTILPGDLIRFQFYHTGVWHRLDGAIAISADRWIHIAISYGDAKGMKLYVDGVEDGTITQGSNQSANRRDCDIYVGDVPGDGDDWSFIGQIDNLRTSDEEDDPALTYRLDDMPLRVHGYGADADYGFDFSYVRAGAWTSLKDRVVATEPINVRKAHREFYEAGLTLDNVDGELTPENTSSDYNDNDGTYDPLLDEARKARVMQGINCYKNLAVGGTVTASTEADGGSPDRQKLTDERYGDPDDESEDGWASWAGISADAALRIKVDLGSSQRVQHGMVSFLSMSDEGIELPATAQFMYSTNNVDFYECNAEFDFSEYEDSCIGQRFICWFTDLDKDARYIRIDLTNIPESNDIYIDEFEVYGGSDTIAQLKPVITGYLGEEITNTIGSGRIGVRHFDVRKKESDNRFVELTQKYTDERPEEIIYDLLTNGSYWRSGTPGEYDGELTEGEIGWASSDNLSGFEIPEWQGQQGTIVDYIDQLAKLIGWVYDCDGDGTRQFWEPERNRAIVHPHLNLFGSERWGRRGTITRVKTGQNIRNYVKIVGNESADRNKPISYVAYHSASMDKYGLRYGRITEPLVRNVEIARQLGQSIVRDFAYAKDGLSCAMKGGFDIERPARICSYHEPIRAHLTKSELWVIDSLQSEMVTDGHGDFRSYLQTHKYMSGPPSPVATIAGVGDADEIAVSWDANSESDIQGYYVYWASGDDPTAWDFTKRAMVSDTDDTITGLTDDDPYWFYVTAVNFDGVESMRSCIVRSLAGYGNSGDEESTWGGASCNEDVVKEGNSCRVDFLTVWGSVFDDWWTGSDCETYGVRLHVNFYGPGTALNPTNIHGQLYMYPYDDSVPGQIRTHHYINFNTDDLLAYPNYNYNRYALSVVQINGIDYHFGTPLYSSPTDNYIWLVP